MISTAGIFLLFGIVISFTHTVRALEKLHEFQRYDGWYNSLANPEWGTVGSRLYRKVPSAYADGVYRIRENAPSPRSLSDLVFNGTDGIPSQRNVTTMLVYFSQVVAYEIMQATKTSCPLEMHKIAVKKCDAVFDKECEGGVMIPFTRAKYDERTGNGFNSPREQTNDITSWIDASFLYSTQEPWVAELRSYANGRLKEDDVMQDYPPLNSHRIPLINPPPPQIHRLMDPGRLFLLGDPRVNENPGLLSFGLILWRWHNRLADRIQLKHPDWSDEVVFNHARRWVIATLQNIIVYEFLPALLDGMALRPYDGYKADLPPGISHVFAAGAFRYPHTMVPPGMLLRKRSEHCAFHTDVGGYKALRMCQNWWNAQDIIQEYSVDDVVLGMASQLAENEDRIVISDLRDYLFGPMHFTRLDLAALGIMRGRDNGLPPYNAVRRAFGLAPVERFQDINPVLSVDHEPRFWEKLSKIYDGDVDQLDLYVGGMLESNGHGPGELFKSIIADQFTRIRDADRFWFENGNNALFTAAEIDEIRRTTLYDVIRNTTDINEDQLQKNVFFWRDGDPCPQEFQVSSEGLEPCVPFMRFDHFMGNEVTFIFTLLGLAVIPIVCAGIGYMMIRHRKTTFGPSGSASSRSSPTSTNSHSSASMLASSEENNNTNKAGYMNGVQKVFSVKLSRQPDKKNLRIAAIEWLHEDYCRAVMVELSRATSTVGVYKPRNERALLRSIELTRVPPQHTVIATVTDERRAARPFVMLTVPNVADMVLRFESGESCRLFLSELEVVVNGANQTLRVGFAADSLILAAAETPERRQAKLEMFFREAYENKFRQHHLKAHPTDDEYNHPESNGHSSASNSSSSNIEVSDEVLRTNLTRAEFADALGMPEDDLFIERLFAIVAKTHKDKISFAEFLDTAVKFSSGNTRDQMEIIFDMCDLQKDGKVDREEFSTFMRSLNMSAGVRLGETDQMHLHDQLLSAKTVAMGQKKKTHFDRHDFDAIFDDITTDRRPIGLHLRGTKHKMALKEESASLQSFALTEPEDEWGTCWGEASWPSKCLAWLEDRRQHITCVLIFYLLIALFFLERFWHYRYENEHRDLRRVMGAGIAITRGSAAAMSLCFAVIPLTVCRNVITRARETPLNQYVPFDSAIVFHKIVAVTALVFSLIHTVGHCINFYHVATQSNEGLQCLFQEAYSSNFQPSISYWFYGTVTGVTGIALVVIMSVIYVFAAPSVINSAYHAFRLTHFLNVILYAVTILHGLPKLLDSPKFLWFIIGPMTVYVIDRIMALRQEYSELQILEAQLLPSNIMHIKLKRPSNFFFRSGNWVRVACPSFSCNFNERHAFSLASAPQDRHLEMYLKVVGPWTSKLRQEIQNAHDNSTIYPVLNMDGPYGGGNQEWFNYEVAVLVGGGIGITPYAAILSDLVQATSGRNFSEVACKKVYFLWVCATHKNFEWFVDVLRKVEHQDKRGVLDVHVFITQFFHKYDLRTTMLYICEKHFRGQAGRSMFTDLKAVNHFGRPKFDRFIKYVQSNHIEQKQVGVFSCGPSQMNKTIRDACVDANRARNKPHFVHRYETF